MKWGLLSSLPFCYNRRLSALALAIAVILQLQIISNDAFDVAINPMQAHHWAENRKNGNLCLYLFRNRQKKLISTEEGYASVDAYAEQLHTFPHDCNDTTIDQYFMDAALRQAQLAWKKNEVPIGAVIVQQTNSLNTTTSSKQERTFRVISEAHNLVETNTDASAHAELLALRRGAQNLQNWRYPPNSTLYSTLEPCPMCLASAQAFRIDNIVFGANDNRLGAIQTHMNLMEVAKHPYHDVKSVMSGVKAEECGSIMVEFFRERRRMKKENQQTSSVLETNTTTCSPLIRRKNFRLSNIKKAFAKMMGSKRSV